MSTCCVFSLLSLRRLAVFVRGAITSTLCNLHNFTTSSHNHHGRNNINTDPLFSWLHPILITTWPLNRHYTFFSLSSALSPSSLPSPPPSSHPTMRDKVFPVLSILSIILILLPAPWHWKNKNSGTLLFIGWTVSLFCNPASIYKIHVAEWGFGLNRCWVICCIVLILWYGPGIRMTLVVFGVTSLPSWWLVSGSSFPFFSFSEFLGLTCGFFLRSVGIPAASLCINRLLYTISTTKQANMGHGGDVRPFSFFLSGSRRLTIYWF